MSFYGRSNRMLIEQALQTGVISGCQIAGCELSGLQVSDKHWDHTDIRDLHANDIVFENASLESSAFFRSSFMRASFKKTVLDTMTLDGLSLIKSRWNDVWVRGSTLKNLCLQRAVFTGGRFISSSFIDFEALDSRVENCVFAHSTFNISYGSGMNGFSNAEISNCVFYHCRFEGYPLRGARMASCTFAYCSGETGDDMDCANVYGIGLRGGARHKALQRADEARRLVEQYVS